MRILPYLGRPSSVHIDKAPGRSHLPLPITIRLNTVCSHNLVMKHLPGADPELVLLGHRFEELERIPLSDMTREEINALVQELGFYRKASPDEPVPPEYLRAPARSAGDAPDHADL